MCIKDIFVLICVVFSTISRDYYSIKKFSKFTCNVFNFETSETLKHLMLEG